MGSGSDVEVGSAGCQGGFVEGEGAELHDGGGRPEVGRVCCVGAVGGFGEDWGKKEKKEKKTNHPLSTGQRILRFGRVVALEAARHCRWRATVVLAFYFQRMFFPPSPPPPRSSLLSS